MKSELFKLLEYTTDVNLFFQCNFYRLSERINIILKHNQIPPIPSEIIDTYVFGGLEHSDFFYGDTLRDAPCGHANLWSHLIHDFHEALQKVNYIEHFYHRYNLSDIIDELNKFNVNQIPMDIIEDFNFTGLAPVDFLFSSYLTKKGYLNIYDIRGNREELLVSLGFKKLQGVCTFTGGIVYAYGNIKYDLKTDEMIYSDYIDGSTHKVPIRRKCHSNQEIKTVFNAFETLFI